MVRIFLPGERALSWNQLYKQEHWSKRHAVAREKQYLVRAALDPELAPFAGRVHIHVVAVFRNRPVDVDNICAKVYIDGLKGFVIRDDSPEYVGRITLECVEGPDNGVLIIVDSMDDE